MPLVLDESDPLGVEDLAHTGSRLSGRRTATRSSTAIKIVLQP
jgi:hypothetical protein